MLRRILAKVDAAVASVMTSAPAGPPPSFVPPNTFDLTGTRDIAVARAAPTRHREVAPGMKAAKWSGGAQTIGYELSGEGLVPSIVVSVGDLVVEDLAPHARHEYAGSRVVAALLSAMPAKPVLAPETDPELVSVLVAAATREVENLRDLFLEDAQRSTALREQGAAPRPHRYLDIRNLEHVQLASSALLLRAVQDLRIAPATALEAFRRAWVAPLVIVRQADGHANHRPHTLARSFPAGVDLRAIVDAVSSPTAWFYEGQAHARFAAELAARRAAATAAATAEANAAIDLSTRRLTTPRAEGLIVAVQPAAEADAQIAYTGPAQWSFHDGNRVRCFNRSVLPADFEVRSAATAAPAHGSANAGGPWRVLADSETISLSGADIAAGQRVPAPRSVLDAIVAVARARAPKREPLGPDDVIDMRSPAFKKHVTALRSFLKACAPAFVPGHDAVPIAKLLAVSYGAVRLRLHATIVACEIFRVAGTKCGDTLEELEAVALELQRDPKCDIFPAIEGAQKS